MATKPNSVRARFSFTLILLFSFSVFEGICQVAPSRYWVQFTDKNNTPYLLSNPAAYLSQKAIDRRTDQGIAIVSNDLPVDPVYVSTVINFGATLLNKSKWFNAITVYTADSSILDSIINLPFVQQVDTVGKHKNPIPGLNHKYQAFESKWDLEYVSPMSTSASTNTDYGSSFNQISMLKGDVLHEQGYRGEGMTIAILDAGFRNANTNPAFDSAMAENRILETWDFVSGDDSVYDNGPHGLWVFSIIAANIPGSIVGTAPKANYLLLRTEDTGSEYVIEEDNWVAGAEFADSAGADILTTSLGYTVFNYASQNHTYLDMDGNTTRISIGSDIAASKGMLVVTAAGNKGSSSWNYIVAPADADNILSIGAVDVNQVYASFSSVGPTSDGRLKPNVVSMGSGTTVITDGGSTQTGGGTSFAAPLISGMAACLWQANPSATNMEVLSAIQMSASQYPCPDYYLGHGIPDFALASLILSGSVLDMDTDDDGVPDTLDCCRNTPYQTIVNSNGCPMSNAANFTVEGFLALLPNPLSGNTSFVYYSDFDETIAVEMLDITGKTVLVQEFSMNAGGNNVINLVIPVMAEGLYVIKVSSATSSAKRKIFKY